MRTAGLCLEELLAERFCFPLQRDLGLGHVVHALLLRQRDSRKLHQLAVGAFDFEPLGRQLELDASVDGLLVQRRRADQRVRGRGLAASEAGDVDDICEEVLQPVVFVFSEELAASEESTAASRRSWPLGSLGPRRDRTCSARSLHLSARLC